MINIKFRFVHFFFLSVIICTSNIGAQSDTLIYNKVPSYRDWNWEALVVENNYITTAIVPSMGGNILQYDLGIDTFLILNPATYGNSYDPAQGQSPFTGQWGFGGFEVWPTPELWPPSPVLTFGEYTDTILYQTTDSICLILRSGTEINSYPGIKFEKQITANKYSTLVKLQNSMINIGSGSVKTGMMNVAEVVTEHGDLEDYNNFKAYFPIRKNSVYGSRGVWISPTSTAFLGEIAPGVYGVEYNPVRGKVHADSPEGWMAFNDVRDTQTYVCLYEVFEGAEYPDQGANTEIYVENSLSFMALEAVSPLVNLVPITDTFRFTQYFASTKLQGPILKANKAGAVAERLLYDSISNQLSGRFGVFSKSTLQLFFLNSLGNVIEEGIIYNATPDSGLIINENLALPEGTKSIELKAYDYFGNLIDIIDTEDFKTDEFITTSETKEFSDKRENPVKLIYSERGELIIKLNLPNDKYAVVDLINISGVVEKVLYSGRIEHTELELNFNNESLPQGVYLIRVLGNEKIFIRKILLK